MFNVPEVVNHVFSFLDYLQVYRLRSVSRYWRSLAEQHIYLRIKNNDDATITLDLCRRNTLQLKAVSFDAEQGIIEFRPTLDVPYPNTLSNFERMISIYFDLWPDQHNPARLQCYSLPSWSTTHFMVERETHLAGHRGLLLSFSYVHTEQERRQKLAMQRRIGESSSSSSSDNNDLMGTVMDSLPVSTYPVSVAATAPVPPKPHIHIAWLRVSLQWIMAGFHPRIRVPPIYPDRFHQLDQILANSHHIYHYNHYLEPVLRHIVEGTREPSQSLVQTISSDDDYQWRLELAIELAGGDPRTRWLDARLWELLNGIDAPSNIDALVDRVKWQLSMAV